MIDRWRRRVRSVRRMMAFAAGFLPPIVAVAIATNALAASESLFRNPLPGTAPHDGGLVKKLEKKWAERPADYRPRTKHLREDGSPKYTNRLFLSSSPYLLQHAHNPVNWYPWGAEAFETAKKLGRPVLLSVGYSTCHWCHVMEEESFEDAEIARFMNEHYVAIKVDREERPDVDAIYMSAVQALTGGGGWPMTVWLTPDRKPFYGGTYFPARDGDRGSRFGFLTLLKKVGEVYHEQPDQVAQSADGHREEGWFFTWTPAEIDSVLDAEQARVVNAYYAVTKSGNFEGRNILHTPRDFDAVAKELKIAPARMRAILEPAKQRLYEARAMRPPPLRDEKILAAWNGLMISAYARAAFVLEQPRYATTAARAADFVLSKMRENGRLRRSYKDGKAQHNAYLDDHAFLTAGLLDLYEVTHEPRWLREAIALDRMLEEHYEDEKAGGFFMTSDDHEELLAREKPGYDGAEPSGNSVHALNLLRLYELTTDDAYRKRADRTLQAFGRILDRSPSALAEMLLAVDFRADTPKEIILVTVKSESEADPFLERLRSTFLPNRVVAVVTHDNQKDHAALVPLVKQKIARGGKATAYVCERQVCDLPTSDPAVFAKQIANVSSPDGDSPQVRQALPHPAK